MLMSSIVIIGGGPSGLAAALEATRRGAHALVIEKLDRVGGLARTVERNDNRYDVGPHRFFTANTEVRDLFCDVLGEDMIAVSRLTRILYGGKYFDYPLTPLNALFGLGIGNSVAILASYAKARLRHALKTPRIETFEDWIIDRFGERLYRIFFKTYTEKVWGIPCDRIGADWAAQRIKGLSLLTAVLNAIHKPKKKIKTLVDEFMYPRMGAGQLYQKMAKEVVQRGGNVTLDSKVVAIHRNGQAVTGIELEGPTGSSREASGDFYLCSAPLTEMLEM